MDRNYYVDEFDNVVYGEARHVSKRNTNFVQVRPTLYDMNESTQNDVVAVRGGHDRRREGAGAESSTPAVAASRAANAESESREGAEWQMVTRGKARAGGAKRTMIRARPSMVEGGDSSQQVAPGFVAATCCP